MPELVELVAKLDLEAHQFCKPPITDLYFSIHKGYSTLPVHGILADSLAAGSCFEGHAGSDPGPRPLRSRIL